MKNLHDYNLWASLKSGDSKAFSTLYKVYYPLLHNYGLKISNYNTQLTEDCLQDFFLYIYQHRENLANLDSIKPYLYVSFRRSLFRELKMASKKVDYDDKVNHFIDINFSAEDVMIQQEIDAFKQTSIVSLLNELPKRQKEVIYLKYYSDLTTDEIAQVLEINYQSTLNLIHKGIKKLRQNALLNELLKNII
ncbi:RNA polymerase sigma factor, sigma-70 family [Flaviramulus basaltis]|uniref:RNA polymerase sigma factor, sigma-70 family n=1 Tax=Flaviramulus basaltis TaxID=369401 RepID=A0A1K2IKI2_9FLAO|nr:sigma-70 family RNA polymerase sigma factor [Flaviramulus basaltis]SFZ92814.1 RNA polymerase sigma factor, sigma-70 family [Flaviramulus basaltis]